MTATVQDQFERYYYRLDDDGKLTVELTNDPLDECVQRTYDTIVKVYKSKGDKAALRRAERLEGKDSQI